MRVALYVRESSGDVAKAPPIEEQIARGRQWAAQNGHDVVEVYADNGFSGGDWKRPAWNRCVSDARRHSFRVLWVWNQDRIARDTEQFLWFYRMMRKAPASIWEDTANEFIDMESLGGRVKHQSMAQAAEIFRLVTSEKVRKAYQRKKAAGGSWGRPAVEFDFAKGKELRMQGLSWRAVAKELGANYQTIRRRLTGAEEYKNGSD